MLQPINILSAYRFHTDCIWIALKPLLIFLFKLPVLYLLPQGADCMLTDQLCFVFLFGAIHSICKCLGFFILDEACLITFLFASTQTRYEEKFKTVPFTVHIDY